MEIIKKYTITHDDPLYHLGFEDFEDKTGDFYFFLGQALYNEHRSGNINSFLRFDKPWYGLTLEEPNFCTHGTDLGADQHTNVLKRFDKIFTIDQSIAEVYKNRTSVFFPFNEKYIPKSCGHDYDIIYTGSIGQLYFQQMVQAIKPFNYACVSISNNPLVTHNNVNYKEKINLISRSKITALHNLVFVHPSDIPRYKNFPHYEKIESFKHIDKGLLPQIKSRTFEAAFSRSLMLCQYDHFNVIEKFFTPEEHFIYFKDFNDFNDKVTYILANYDMYIPMIERAYNRAVQEFTTRAFVQKYLQ